MDTPLSQQPESKSSDFRIWIAFLAYTITIIAVSFFHEAWRDEAVPINILRDSSSLWDFYEKTQNYGHPRLWHTLIYLGHLIFPYYSVVKILNITICSAAIFVFLKFSPFKFWQKILFILGIFPIYIYPAFSRHYGLCMLLVFILACLYQNRWKHIVAFSITLILLANTHVHTLIITMPIFLVLVLEYFSASSRRTILNTGTLVFLLTGLILAVIQIIPNSITSLTKLNAVTGPAVLKALAIGILFPGKIFDQVFGVPSALWSNIVIYAAAFYFSNNKRLLMIFSLNIIGLTMFSILFYPSDALRHQGFVFLILIFGLWVSQTSVQPETSGISTTSALRKHLEHHKNAYIAALLILQICMAYPAVRKDILKNYSSAKPLAVFLADHPELDGAVFIPEPDFLFESVPYYKPDIKIFLPRESALRSYIKFTSENRMSLSLDELLKAGETVHRKHKKPVVFIIGHSLSPDGLQTIYLPNGRIFTFSKESYETFMTSAKPLKSFQNALSDENYDLYLLKESEHP